MKTNKIYSFIFALSVLIILVSCSSEQALVFTPVENCKPQLTNDEFSFLERYIKKTKAISPDEAAIKVISQGSEAANTRSTDVNITKIDVLRKENYNLFGDSIYNLLPDTLVYLVSTDDGMCTAMPADYRASTPVLGNFPQSEIYNMETETDWAIHDMMCEMFASTTAYEICDYEARHDSIEKIILGKLNIQSNASSTRSQDNPAINPNDYDFYEVYGPRIIDMSQCNPQIPYAWNQKMPYNYNVRYKNGCSNCPVGCAALAAAMIMTYWSHPSTVNGSSVNWSAIKSQNSYSENQYSLPGASQLAWLLEQIGTGMNMQYLCSESTTNFIRITQWLSTNSYSCANPIAYGYNYVKASLDNGRPVVISGFPSTGSIGHAWVIHGYRESHIQQEKTIYAVHKVTGQQIVYYNGTTYTNEYIIYNNMGNGSGTTSISSSSLNTLNFGSYNNNKTIYTQIHPQ